MRIVLLALVMLAGTAAGAEPPSARELVQQAMDHWRGVTSHSVISMTIHRPDWERSMTLEGWSKGDKLSLVRVIEPPRDAGNATLLDDSNMWTYTPKINRIIKVPSSMMAQSWMGSDFSNKDIAKSTDIIDEYDHELTASETRDGHTVYTVTSIPHEDAAVVWGKEVLLIRDDFVLLEQQYWDQDGVLVKKLETRDVAEMGGRPVARVMQMADVDKADEWTRITTREVTFDLELPPQLFTLSNLRNPRQ
ncbi:MAG: outer membrane lipoprotein-sorting protein [Xanthomonadales bacterium]